MKSTPSNSMEAPFEGSPASSKSIRIELPPSILATVEIASTSATIDPGELTNFKISIAVSVNSLK